MWRIWRNHQSHFKSVDAKEKESEIKSVVTAFKDKKPEDVIEQLVNSISFIKNINEDFYESLTNFIIMGNGTSFPIKSKNKLNGISFEKNKKEYHRYIFKRIIWLFRAIINFKPYIGETYQYG